MRFILRSRNSELRLGSSSMLYYCTLDRIGEEEERGWVSAVAALA